MAQKVLLVNQEAYTTAEVAALVGVSLRQLQWWDEQGFISPTIQFPKRLYNANHLLQIAVVVELRRKGLTLQAIRRFPILKLNYYTPPFLIVEGRVMHARPTAQDVIALALQSVKPLILVSLDDLKVKIQARSAKCKK
jgi:DNA-binding transcriptional MerR regulator